MLLLLTRGAFYIKSLYDCHLDIDMIKSRLLIYLTYDNL